MEEKNHNTQKPQKKSDIKIGYVTIQDPNDKSAWSGTQYFIRKALRDQFNHVYDIGPLQSYSLKLSKAYNKLRKLFGGRHKIALFGPFVSRSLARSYLKKSNPNIDIYFFSAASSVLAHTSLQTPAIYITDATFRLVCSHYPEFSDLGKRLEASGENIEKKAILKADKIIYPSTWAAQSAKEHYSCDESKIVMHPFGANFERPPKREEVHEAIQSRTDGNIKLLFVGMDWERKGGTVALEIFNYIRAKGYDVELTLVGRAPHNIAAEPAVEYVGIINKNDYEDSNKLSKLYLESSFLLFPTKFECAGIVSSEASAFGLPIISHKTGGVPSYVTEGENGCLFEIGTQITDYANYILDLWNAPEAYEALCLSARDKYEEQLNWNSWGRTFRIIAEELAAGSSLQQEHI